MTTDLYTPLESFLLLRNLGAGHNGAQPFDTISTALKTNPILQRNDGYNATRLDPEPLKALYLKLLKDEAKSHLQNETVGRPSSSPRKRKLSSPRLESLEDATSYAHLLPQLIERAYFHYQTVAVQAIRQEESKVRQVQDHVASRTKKPEEGAEQRNGPPTQTGSHGVPSIQGLLRHEEERARQEQREQSIKQGQGQMRSGGYNTIPPVMNGVPFPRPPSTDYKGAQQPVYGASPTTGSADTQTPYLPPPPLPLPAHPPLQYPLPSNDYSARRPSPSGSAASPISRNSQQPLPSQERPSQSPIILPPPTGLLRSTSKSGRPEGQSDSSAPPRRPPPSRSPQQANQAAVWAHPNRPPPPRGYGQQGYGYQDAQGYPQYPPQYNPAYHPQNYPATTNAPHGSAYPAPSSYQAPLAHPQYSSFPANPQYYSSPSNVPMQYRQTAPMYHDPRTPVATPSDRRPPISLTPVTTSTSSTKWKNVGYDKPPGSPSRPSSRDVSPISEKAASPEPEPEPSSVRGSRSKALRGKNGGAASLQMTGDQNSRGIRSPSASSQNDARQRSRASNVRKIKAELHDESERGESERPITPRAIAKRKRVDSTSLLSPSVRPILVPAPTRPRWPRRPGFVLVLRNLQKSAGHLLSTIQQHKFGSVFAKPLTEREAPGYNALIHRVQDLKTIKAAISAGNKAIAALAEDVPSSVHLLWVPESEDVVPPKAIVNPVQLETELVRIFANAVMFNPDLEENRGFGPAFRTRAKTLVQHKEAVRDGNGEDSESVKHEIGVARPEAGAMVKDAREMFAFVEERLEEFQSVGEVSDTAAADAPVVGGEGGSEVEGNSDDAGDEEQEEEKEDEEEEESQEEVTEEPRSKRRRR